MSGGSNGNPKIVGNPWGEYVFGTPDSDRIDGRAGNDTINGYCGNDTITGGSGADLFVMDRSYQTWGGGQDVVTDFDAFPGGHDSVRFTGWGGYTSPASGALYVGETFATDLGYTLTVKSDAAGGTLLVWSTGDSIDLRGVAPAAVQADWIISV